MPTPTASVDPTNLLLGLAWLGELDRRQIQRLWFVDKSESTVEKTLARLHKEALIARRTWSIRDEQRGVTVPQLARWSLTPAGHALIKASDQYPEKPAQVRQQRLMLHDTRTTEAIVRLIEIGRRSRLSGIYVARELRLNPQENRPICDALVVMQFGSFDRPNLVPWSSDPAIEDEGRLRFAIEADNDTEPLGVLAGKARAYRRLAEDDAWAAWWMRQHGPLPIPLWVAPTRERAMAIHRQWKRAWPAGRWLVTSDTGLRQNELLSWTRHVEERIALGFAPPPPAAPAALPAPQSPAALSASAPPAATPALPAPPQLPPPSAPAPAATPLAQPAGPAASVPRSSALLPAPAVVMSETDTMRAPDSRGWEEIIWAGLVRATLLLWAALLLPWRVVRAAYGWYQQLDYLWLERVRLATFTAMMLSIGLYIVVARPSWLPGPWQGASPDWARSVATAPPPPLADTATPAPSCPAARVTASRVNLRAGPGREEMIWRTLEAGELLIVRDCRGHEEDGHIWWEVTGEDGMRGWAAIDWLEEIE